jgi:hypothetical protein
MRGLLAALILLATTTSRAEGPPACQPLPAVLARAVERGWTAYRANEMARADSLFAVVLARCPRDVAAANGRGYVRLRRGDAAAAARAFDAVLARRPRDHDALTGRALAAWRLDDLRTARAMFERVLVVTPGDAEALRHLAQLPAIVDSTMLPPHVRPAQRTVAARTGRRILEVPDGRGGWKPMWIKMLNLGAALPGRHPSEFPPDDGTYERWIALADSMGINTLRVYTIHPPHFYRALRAWNLAHAARPMWLVHGVWTELPPGAQEENYDDAAWKGEFVAEMRRVVDLLHGRAAIPHRAGHASGMYLADVSRWTLGYIIGREWEPYSVVAYSRAHPARTTFRGRYLAVEGGNAVDAWMAEVGDHMIGYEMERWNAQRPLAYTNWPTLDPLHHPTESTLEEEDSLRALRGERVAERPREFDNDAIGLDASLVKATVDYPAGTFASYHAYPYYPDFMVLDPGYLKATSPEGPSAYYGYLRELVEHHGDMPVVISEYGVPSSRGNAHVQPQGWDHGGHGEAEQAAIDARLTRDIHAAGAAGAGLFAIIDEWFKKNWLVIDFERPLERNRLWLNPLDAEQNYGVIAMRAGHRDSATTVDGRGEDWGARGRWYERARDRALPAALRLDAMRVRSDEAYLHLRLDVGAVDWSRARYLIGIDTYRSDLGDTRLPYTGTRSPVGLEFVLDLRGPADSRLLVDEPYNLYRPAPIAGSRPPAYQLVYNAPFRTVANDDGRYDTLWVQTNRRRIGRDGTVYPAITHDRGLLVHARQRENTLADWYADSASGVIELRIPWGMLHVLDPSTRSVLYSAGDGRDPEGQPTDGFRFVVESYDPRDPVAGGDRLPRDSSGSFTPPPPWSWRTWEEPAWHAEVKPLFEAMRATLRRIGDDGRARWD